MSLKKKSKGFTLIELMIVVAIIGILAAVAIPKFADLVTKSKEAAVKGNLGAIRSALAIYYGDNEGIYPATVAVFTSLTAGQRYMPNVGGVASMGDYSVPSHSAGTGNPGHTGRKVTADSQVVGAFDDAQPLWYVSQANGEIVVSCSHVDTKGTRWTAH